MDTPKAIIIGSVIIALGIFLSGGIYEGTWLGYRWF